VLNFPDSPVIGEIFSGHRSSWIWDGVKWDVASAHPRYIVACFVPDKLTANQSLLLHRFSKAVTFPIDFGDYLGHSSEMRGGLMKQLAARVPFEAPASLVDREIDRRIEDFARRLMEQQVDPREAGIDWNAFRESQREAAREAVGGALALDEVARREGLEVTEEEVEREVARYGERTGRTPAAVRARLEKEGGMARIHSGLRREKAIDFLMARATISGEP